MSTVPSNTSAPQKRIHPFSLRLSDAEKAHLSRAAGSRSMASYAREQLFGVSSEVRLVRVARAPTVDRQLLAQALGRLGSSNLSRDFSVLASAAASGALDVTPELCTALEAACADLRSMHDEFIRAMGLKVCE